MNCVNERNANNLTPSPPRKKTKISNDDRLGVMANANNTNNKSNNQPQNQEKEYTHLYTITNIKNNDNNILLELNRLHLSNSDSSNKIYYCYLHDSWMNCMVEVNYLVNVLCEADSDGNYHITEKDGFLIVNPHMMLSGTTILSSLYCMRRSALSWKFRETNKSNNHMLLGTLLHMLFQEAITKKKYLKNELETILCELLKQKTIISQMYESDINEEYLLKESVQYMDNIEKWLREHIKIPFSEPSPLTGNKSSTSQQLLKNINLNTMTVSKSLNTIAAKMPQQKQTNNNNNNEFEIINVCDIEESIWSPKYGIKGNIDLTVQIERKSLNSNTKSENDIIPMELKSGKSTFSVEHEGQVMLYSLLNKEKRSTPDYGLLLYLKDTKMKFVKATHNSLKGLLQLRNDLVYYINSNRLPAVKNEDRVCSKCELLTVCSLFNNNKQLNKMKIEYEKNFDENDDDDQIGLYSDSVKHLNENCVDYFFKWYQMLEHEFKDDKQFESGEYIWHKTIDDLEDGGFAVGYLTINNKPCDLTKKTSNNFESFLQFEFKRNENAKNLANICQLKDNDMVLLSTQDKSHIGVSQGFIKSIRNNFKTFVIMLDKDINKLEHENTCFRIDKINYRSSICINYTNLSKLITNNEQSAKLRQFIIEKKNGTFEKVLCKQDILKTKHFFKKLNQNQQSAVIRTLMANDYLLIKGYPGTGKTSTIAALIAVLLKLGKKVLFTSFTNSAVDNLLLKLVNEYEIDFLRIGSSERIHSDIRKYESNYLTSKITSVIELKQFYESKQLVATTCSSINHPIFNHILFDYCIVDEASQVLQTLCLGPLLVSKKFVLVGDIEQLPPIVKRKEARLAGMNVSLFELLDSNGDASIELVCQYRMNKEIMNIANEVSYKNKLKCVSEEVSNQSIKIDQTFLQSIKCEMKRKILQSSVIFIDTSELIKNENENNDTNKKHINKIECNIVLELCNVLYENSDCKSVNSFGIIAPYNDQVKALKCLFTMKSELKHIEINTVDQFQGRDKRVILLSFTNSIDSEEASKEFEILNDKRRLTVAITRAKEKLILIGSVKTLTRYKPINNLITIMNKHDYIVKLKDLNDIYF